MLEKFYCIKWKDLIKFTKQISVGFLQPIFRSLVLQRPALKPFNKKKEIESEKVMCNDSYFVFAFSNFSIAEIMSVPYYFTINVRMVYVNLIVHFPFFSMKFLYSWISIILSVLQNFITDEYKKARNFLENLFLVQSLFFGNETCSKSS